MKKILVLLITAFFMISGFTAFADELPVVYVTDLEATGASDITVSVSLSENACCGGGSMNLIYDKSLLKAKSYNVGEILEGYIANVNPAYAEDTVRFSWAGAEEITSGGVLFSVTFEVLSRGSFETGITIDKLKLADINGDKIEAVSENGNIKYIKGIASETGGHSVRASGSVQGRVGADPDGDEKNGAAVISFSDVRESDWFYGYVKTVYEKGLMKGVSETEFAPNEKLTRAMFVTILYRMEGEPETDCSDFEDIEAGSWYEKAVGWASANGIVSGIGKTEFAPNADITREQMAAIIFRYAKYKGIDTEAVTKDTNTLSHNDVFDVSDWAKEAMHYSIAAGIINGDDSGNLLPHNTATRAETATVIVKFTESVLD